MKSKLFFLIVLLLFFVLESCNFNLNSNMAPAVKVEKKLREWTFLVYMAADNDLEAASIQDFNELEAVKYKNIPITILVLVDRSPSYDNSNGNWSGTRLYEIKTDPNGLDGIIRSKKLEFPELGLSLDEDVNINTADYTVLRKCIDFTQTQYPAKKYGLIMWGHGTGWRGGESYTPAQEKAFAIDETSESYMRNAELGKALVGKKVDLVCFDTCFGGILETAYEIKEDASCMIASETTVPANGWDYTSLFNSFIKTDLTTEDFGLCAIEQFKSQYEGEQRVSLSVIDLKQIQNVKSALDSFGTSLGSLIVDTTTKKSVLDVVLEDTLTFSYGGYPCELYIDIFDFAKHITNAFTSVGAQSLSLQESLKNAIPYSWSSFESGGYNLGLYAFDLSASGVPSSTHSDGYVSGSGAVQQTKFVKESDGWVPHKNGGNSFLDKLFYTSY